MVTLQFSHAVTGASRMLAPVPSVQVSFGLVRIEGQEIARITADELWRYDGEDWTDFVVRDDRA